jgi:hypothetical protein
VAGVAVGDSPYHLIVEIQFQSEQQMQSSLNSRSAGKSTLNQP